MHNSYFSNPNNFISSDQLAWCADFCKKNWPGEVRHILRIADDARNKTFLFDLKWDMERTYEPVHFDGPIKWDYMPGDDPEFIFQFNRHQFFICLGQAYALTGDEAYAETFASQLSSWIAENPLNEDTKKTTWRSIEAGIRGETWVKAMSYFKESPSITEDLLARFEDCLRTHARYLMESYRYFQIKSNWGVIESRGLFEIALALGGADGDAQAQSGADGSAQAQSGADNASSGKETAVWLKTAVTRLAEGLRVQILDDGMQWEQSPMYHNEVFHCSLEALRLAKRYGIPLPETYVETIRRMAYANLTWKKPNHCQVTQGDSDETDLRDLLSQSAYLFSDPVLKSGGFSCMDFDGAWDYLQEGAERYEAMEAQEPDFLVKDMECSGNFYLRSGWTENSDFFHFRSGSLGGGHGHSEKLHMDLVIGGEDILMDSGRYHYVDDEIRHTLKNALSHNTPTIDSRDYVTCLDSWGVKGMSPAYHRPFCQKNGFTLVQGGHAGYLQEGLGDVYINRRVLALGTDLYVVADEFFTAGEHEFQQNFHFNPDGKVKLKNAGDDLGCGENGSPIPSAHYSGQTVDADFIFVESPAKTCDSSLQVQLKDSRLSRNYNQMENNQSLTISRKKSGFCCLLTVIAGGKKDSYQAPEVTPLEVTCSAGASVRTEEEAHGLRIAFNGKTYVVIISHTDIGHNSDLLAAGGYLGLGTVIVFEEGDAKTGGTVMCW